MIIESFCRTQRVLLSLLVMTAFASPVGAAGFAIKDQSSLALGNAFAGATSGAEEVSYMFFNPAGLTRQKGVHLHLDTSYIHPKATFKDGAASTVLGGAVGGKNRQRNLGQDALVPAFYAMLPMGSSWRAGLGVNAPFGQTTDYDDGWVGRYHALRSELSTVNINPALALEVNAWLSIGVGAQVQYLETDLTNAVDFGTIGAAAGISGAVPTAQDGEASLRGDDWSFGYNGGVLLTPSPRTRIGLAYRSKIDHELRGRARFELDQAGTGSALSAATGRFVDTGASADVTLPETFSLGAYHELGESWAVMGEFAWTSWSDFSELRVTFDNPNEEDNVTEQGYRDTVFAALGLTWRADEAWTLRGGVAYDQGATKDKLRTPRAPGGNRYWFSSGIGYAPSPWFEASAAFTYIAVEDSRIDLTTDGAGNRFRGNLSGEVESDVYVGALSATLRF